MHTHSLSAVGTSDGGSRATALKIVMSNEDPNLCCDNLCESFMYLRLFVVNQNWGFLHLQQARINLLLHRPQQSLCGFVYRGGQSE